MNIEEQLRLLSHQTYPHQVDVVDAVMDTIRKQPLSMKTQPAPAPRPLWPRLAVSSAAAVIALVVVNLTLFRSHTYNEALIGNTIADVSDYSYYAPVESLADNPVDCLYTDLY